MIPYSQKLNQSILNSNSLLCLGLDPDLEKMPHHLLETEDPVFEFCKAVIEESASSVCAYKLNIAFFAALGERGWSTMRRVLSVIPSGVVTIADAKVGDIGNSSEKWASTYLDEFGFDSITVSPYMGTDSVEPFIRRPGKGAFLLALTSNPGSADFQVQRLADGRSLYESVIDQASAWNKHGNLGIVTGATRSDQLKSIRNRVPDMVFLIPGIGAQGGDLKETLANSLDKYRRGVLINVGRDILYASRDENFRASVAKRTGDYVAAINKVRFTITV